MQLFLDSADEKQVKYWLGQGVLDGVTTNPSVLFRDGVVDPLPALESLARLTAPGVLHAEVTVPRGAELVHQGIELSQLADNIAVKVPVQTPDGAPCLAEIHELSSAGVAVNSTACLSFGQAALAAKAGASYLSILVGRIDDEGGDGAAVIRDLRRWLDDWQVDAKIIAASVRGTADVRRSMTAGAHCVTVPPAVLAKLADHKYSRHTVQQFLDDARAVAG
ncbi:transaldolase family protein [Kitasatospora sp. NPDC089509]|uniref:transaldolase family protein n=1 Tax=Kitasatospora sp. NPDC089509 TaxID=3364079 RepID=UPI0037F22885